MHHIHAGKHGSASNNGRVRAYSRGISGRTLALTCTLACTLTHTRCGITPVAAVPLSDAYITDYHAFLTSAARNATPPNKYSLFELHWMAPFLSGSGYASEAIALILGLMTQSQVRVSAGMHGDGVNVKFIRGLPPLEYNAINSVLSQSPHFPDRTVCVCHSEPGAWQLSERLPQRYPTLICPLSSAGYRVGRTMFETDRLPAGWAERLNAMDEVWVPTSFTAQVFKDGGVDEQKLLVVPEAVDVRAFDPSPFSAVAPYTHHVRPRHGCNGTKAMPGTASCPFRFISVGKWERRKNFEALLRAYMTEFMAPPSVPRNTGEYPDAAEGECEQPEPGDFVELYILTSAYHSPSDFDAAVSAIIEKELVCKPSDEASGTPCIPAEKVAAKQLPEVKLLTDVRQIEMAALYASMDAFVLPSRGEGWGRPHVEAMAMELPVIATLWSGPSEFMTQANSYPLNHTHLAPIPDGAFAGHLQAEPDVRHLMQLMRHVYNNPFEATEKGKAARRDMVANYSPDALAQFVAHQVARITAHVSARREQAATSLSDARRQQRDAETASEL